MRKITERWEGDYLVQYATATEYRYTAVVHSVLDGDLTFVGDWREDDHTAAHTLSGKIQSASFVKYTDFEYVNSPRETTREERVRTWEVQRWHRSHVILCPGGFGKATRPIIDLIDHE